VTEHLPDRDLRIALLRAVNVAGSGMVSMEALRDLLGKMRFADVRSVIQSGNLVFRTRSGDNGALERRLESEVARTLGLRTEIFVRTAPEWTDVVRQNPFPEMAKRDPGHLVLTVLRESPPPSAWDALRSAIRGREEVRGIGRQAYFVYPDGTGRSTLTPALIERKLGTRGTSRNWNTVTRLERLLLE